MKKILFISTAVVLLYACNNAAEKNEPVKKDSASPNAGKPGAANTSGQPMASLAEILSKREVPVLCYHHIRAISPSESETMKSYSVTPGAFAEQMKTLYDSGYHTILPDQLYEYLVHNGSLPSKPIMLTFDDTDEEQYSIGAKEMNKYGFKGVYFVMTISINRPRYMSKEQLKELADSGHVIAAHTWDHHMVTKYTGNDWDVQLVKPRKQLEAITGKSIDYFAYPFGLWNQAAIPELKSRNYKLAFILSTKRDSTEPLYTVRRMIVPGTWSTQGMLKAMNATFNKKQ
ncbi:MAG: polysaccharide deacetylase family protein [Bacteroidetes bacterium]|nr:polysaccharide deacetylase family protein [Bacteroidota bacterium]